MQLVLLPLLAYPPPRLSGLSRVRQPHRQQLRRPGSSCGRPTRRDWQQQQLPQTVAAAVPC